MPSWTHRTTFQTLPSVAEANLPEAVANYVEEPDLAAVAGQPRKYWLLNVDTFTLMDQAARDVVDAALLVGLRDSRADEIDRPESFLRSFALLLMDELNTLRAEHGLAARTPAQLKTALRNRMDT
jgi:hypothetical protein